MNKINKYVAVHVNDKKKDAKRIIKLNIKLLNDKKLNGGMDKKHKNMYLKRFKDRLKKLEY